jgi:hypothetical protein
MSSTETAINSNKKRKEMDETINGSELVKKDGKESYEELEKELVDVKAELIDTLSLLKEANAEKESLKAKLEAKEEEEDEEDSDDNDSVTDPSDQWMARYYELRQFRIINGHCTIPQKTTEQKKLSYWVKDQKKAYKSRKMSQDRIARLEGLGISWGKDFPTPRTWEECFTELEQFKATVGNCNIHMNPNNPSQLAKWVSAQRSEFKRFRKGTSSLLTPDQIQQLRDIGFKFKGPRLS